MLACKINQIAITRPLIGAKYLCWEHYYDLSLKAWKRGIYTKKFAMRRFNLCEKCNLPAEIKVNFYE